MRSETLERGIGEFILHCTIQSPQREFLMNMLPYMLLPNLDLLSHVRRELRLELCNCNAIQKSVQIWKRGRLFELFLPSSSSSYFLELWHTVRGDILFGTAFLHFLRLISLLRQIHRFDLASRNFLKHNWKNGSQRSRILLQIWHRWFLKKNSEDKKGRHEKSNIDSLWTCIGEISPECTP